MQFGFILGLIIGITVIYYLKQQKEIIEIKYNIEAKINDINIELQKLQTPFWIKMSLMSDMLTNREYVASIILLALMNICVALIIFIR